MQQTSSLDGAIALDGASRKIAGLGSGASSARSAVHVLGYHRDHGATTYEVVAEPLAGPAMHFHTYDEVFDIVEGSMTFCLDGEVVEAATGANVVVPAGTYHSWLNRSSHSVTMRVRVPAHAVYEAVLCSPDTLPRDAFCTVAARYGVLVVGPPLSR